MPTGAPDTNKQVVVITGATSLIGHFLLPRLIAAHYLTKPLSRTPQSSKTCNWHLYDGSLSSASPGIGSPDILIHLAPLRLLPGLINEFAGLGGRRIIAFSSTSRFSKLNSSVSQEREIAEGLLLAEENAAALCEEKNIPITIFRPTLIYGAGLDKNISSISQFIQKFGFFPIVGTGKGLRQPVHADDLASASVAVINNEKTYNQSYDLVGGETLSYRQMVEKIFSALRKKPRFLTIPLPLFRLGMKLISFIPDYSHATPDMANRMNDSLNFDCQNAKRDFNYTHREFSLHPSDLNRDRQQKETLVKT